MSSMAGISPILATSPGEPATSRRLWRARSLTTSCLRVGWVIRCPDCPLWLIARPARSAGERSECPTVALSRGECAAHATSLYSSYARFYCATKQSPSATHLNSPVASTRSGARRSARYPRGYRAATKSPRAPSRGIPRLHRRSD